MKLAAVPGVEVSGVAYDSRRVTTGDIFIALKGLKAAGTDYAAEAVKRGAVAVVADRPPDVALGVPWVVVPDARAAMAAMAAELYGHPSRSMQVVGITGTNGKTTTAYLLRAVFESAGKKCGLLGTVAYSVGDRELPALRTTPEAPDVQRMFRQMVDAGCGGCVMEVSSHALALRRVDGTAFAAGVFTNLTRDHLDYHGDMESYFAAKKRLFEMLPPGAPRVINLDDPRGESLRKAADTVVTYAINKPADVTPGPLTLTFGGLEFDARTPKGNVHVTSRLVGRPNVSNVLATVATATALDIPAAAIERGLAKLTGVPGRFELVSSSQDDVTVVIDYAHTDDALKNLLETARPLAQRRVITVFGCGGDRDRTKRPLMGAVAARLSDIVVMTSDNPRTEDPARIIEEIKRGVPSASERAGATFTILDRKEAIQFAIRKAEPGDLVLLAGKGHEHTQVIGGQELSFDEAAIAREALGAETLTPAVVAAAIGAKVAGPGSDREISGFSIDTRTLSPGDLFLAIRGDRFDGNVYVAEAVAKGAVGAIVSDPALTGATELAGIPLIVTPDTIAALQALASRVRRDSGAAVVAVTGSAGKSTTKEITATFLAARYTVFRNRGNLNNHIGLPLSLLELRTNPDIGVLELGMNHAGEISVLVKIAEPEVRVWTNVGPAHLEFFGTVDAIAEAKAEILEGADHDSLLVANADDDLVMRHASKFAGRVRTFGVERPADVRALAVRDLGVDGTAAIVRTPIGEAEIRTPLPGTANLSNILAATGVAIRFDVPLDDIVERAAGLKPVARRGEVIRAGGVTIIDDSYNSNPNALSRALAMLGGEMRYERRVAVIGEMLELGAAAGELHRAAGEEAARWNVGVLVAVGGANARAVADGAIEAGMAASQVHYVENSKAAAELVATLVMSGDVVLVKGSRGIRTEVVVDRLKVELG